MAPFVSQTELHAKFLVVVILLLLLYPQGIMVEADGIVNLRAKRDLLCGKFLYAIIFFEIRLFKI